MRTWQQIRENQTAIPKEELSLIDTLSFLQALRVKEGVSQTEFAKRINMTHPQLAKIENLDTTPTLETLNKYAKGLGLEIKLSILPLETSK
jgi:transcriptional regulator with XRE-family HTH domain